MNKLQAEADAIIQRMVDEGGTPVASVAGDRAWQRSVKHVARAQAILWHNATREQRKEALAKAEESMKRSGE